jgi:hypothetical protein
MTCGNHRVTREAFRRTIVIAEGLYERSIASWSNFASKHAMSVVMRPSTDHQSSRNEPASQARLWIVGVRSEHAQSRRAQNKMTTPWLSRLLESFCQHRFSWPHTGAHGQDYQVCLICGVVYEYDVTTMRRTRRLVAPSPGFPSAAVKEAGSQS